MPVKVNYLTLKNSETIALGQIEFFDYYIETSSNFPFLNLNQKNVVLQYNNWPELVPYLYEKKIDIVNNGSIINSFNIATLSITGNNATLNFTNANAIKIITALREDRESYYSDNGTYTGWNKTFTPINDIAYNSVIYFSSGNNFYISNITINSNSASISGTSLQSGSLTDISLSNISIDFGLYRIPGQIKSGATFTGNIFFNGFNGKYLCSDNGDSLINGLNVKSQMLAHSHRHIHTLNNHTHIFSHRHGMNNHTHNMSHSHSYIDSKSSSGSVYVGTSGAHRSTQVAPLPSDIYNETFLTDKNNTDTPNINITGLSSVSTTDTIDKNLTSAIIYTQTVTPDGDLNSNTDNLKINSVIVPESYTIYAYMYGKKYTV
jgi:hypothetical protein